MTNLVLETIKNRHSKRSFSDNPVPLDIVKNVLEIAANAPSSKNMQPWQVAVVQGETLKTLSAQILHKFDNDISEEGDYQYTSEPVAEELMNRARTAGLALFELKGIGHKDFEKRRLHNRENYLFFNATTQILFFLPKNAERGQFLDLGFYMQNVMLGLLSEGISSCAQVSVAKYANTIREILNLDDSVWVISGLACGYADDNKVNSFIPGRIDVNHYVKYYA